MKKVFTTAILTFCVSVIYSQRSTTIGVELASSSDIYKITEQQLVQIKSNASELSASRPTSSIVGLNIRRNLNSTFYLETGLHLKTYSVERSFEFNENNFTIGYSNNNYFRSFIIPVKMGVKVNLYKDKVQLTPNMGFSLVKNHFPKLNPNTNQGTGTYAYPSNSSLIYSYSTRYNTSSYVLFQTGIGLDVKLTRAITLSLAGSNYQGFKKVISQDIKYNFSNQPERAAQSYSNGSMRTFSFGLKFAL
jgi:hypothetical protein